jgi:hypothetical protein
MDQNHFEFDPIYDIDALIRSQQKFRHQILMPNKISGASSLHIQRVANKPFSNATNPSTSENDNKSMLRISSRKVEGRIQELCRQRFNQPISESNDRLNAVITKEAQTNQIYRTQWMMKAKQNTRKNRAFMNQAAKFLFENFQPERSTRQYSILSLVFC